MHTTIDAAGRLVIPKSVRDAMGLAPGTPIDVVFTDGRIEIEIAPMDVVLDHQDGLPLLRPVSQTARVADADVRAALEASRR